MLFIGIDPGDTGGVAVLNDKDDTLTFSKYKRPFGSLLDELELEKNEHVILLEKVGASPQMGTTSAFTFGKNSGSIEEAILDRSLECYHLLPQEWQSHFDKEKLKGDYDKKKQKLFLLAKELFPNLKFPKYIADAILIAKFLKDRHGNNTSNYRKLVQ
jgi:hypothetical protein